MHISSANWSMANHPSATEHLPAIWKRIGEDVRRQKYLVTQKSAAHEIRNLRLSSFGAAVTHKARIFNDFSFAEQGR